MLDPFLTPWNIEFEELVDSASKSLQVASPYVGRGPCELIANKLQKRGTDVSLDLLTNLSRDNVVRGSTDTGAIADLLTAHPGTNVRFLPRLHAKIYIVDHRVAVVTSANLTNGGLFGNVEYGVRILNSDVVRRIATDFESIYSLGSRVGLAQLRLLEKVSTELKELTREQHAMIRKEYRQKLEDADTEIRRVRVEGLSPHAAFADTVLHVLRRGPMKTQDIYVAVQEIHPDLCDDSMKLVIKGEEWSQAKWRHRVRHAQDYLRRKGRVRLQGGKWSLVV